MERTEYKAPDLDDYVPTREAYMKKNILDSSNNQQQHKKDMEARRYEEYLRERWSVTDGIPPAFDPEQLEAGRKSRYKGEKRRPVAPLSGTSPLVPAPLVIRKVARKVVGGEVPMMSPTSRNSPPLDGKTTHVSREIDVYGPDPLADLARMSLLSLGTRSLDTIVEPNHSDNERRARSNADPTGTLTERRSRSRSRSRSSSRSRSRSESRSNSKTPKSSRQCEPEIPGRSPRPRIRAGSKPPLSPSAFVDGGVPCLDEKCRGACKRTGKTKNGRVKPPPYFPYKNGSRRSSKTRHESSSSGGDGGATPS